LGRPARRRRAGVAADLRVHEARDRGDQRPGGRRRDHDDAADGRAPGRPRSEDRLRLYAPRDRPRVLLELVPAAALLHTPGEREEDPVAKTARDVMTKGAECVQEDQSVIDAAKRLAELDIGAMPICGTDGRLKGMLTDRDIVVKVLAKGKDPSSVKAGELGQ